MQVPLLDSRNRSMQEGLTANLEHLHNGHRKSGPGAIKCISSEATLAEGESPEGQEESFYTVMKHVHNLHL